MNDSESKTDETASDRPSGDGPGARTDRDAEARESNQSRSQPREYGGRKGPDPVRYGDWEKNGRCIDF